MSFSADVSSNSLLGNLDFFSHNALSSLHFLDSDDIKHFSDHLSSFFDLVELGVLLLLSLGD